MDGKKELMEGMLVMANEEPVSFGIFLHERNKEIGSDGQHYRSC